MVGQCTWYCWSKAHVKADAYPDRGIDVSHIPIGGAQDWIAEAENYYNIGDEPKADSIAVWRVSSKKGHVAYVETCDSNNVCYSEANWYTGGNPSWEIYVPKAYKDTIAYNVAKLTDKVTVYSTAPDGKDGKDGLFQTMGISEFKTKSGVPCKFIYLKEPK